MSTQQERTHPARMPDRPLPCPPHPTTIPQKGGCAPHPLLHRPTLNLSAKAGSLHSAHQSNVLPGRNGMFVYQFWNAAAAVPGGDAQVYMP